MLVIHILSFSFLKGLPADTTGHGGGYVFDCRAIENPGRLPEFERLAAHIKATFPTVSIDIRHREQDE